jgi:amino acid transporter
MVPLRQQLLKRTASTLAFFYCAALCAATGEADVAVLSGPWYDTNVAPFRTKLLAKLQGTSVFLNLALALATVVGLPIARRHDLNDASYTFGGFENLSGWPAGFSFILSWLAPVWTICELFLSSSLLSRIYLYPGSFDCAVSISEEASNASMAVPWAIVGAVGIAGVTGLAILIILALTMG